MALFTLLGYVSRQKLLIKGSPLVPADLLLVKEAAAVSGQFGYIYFFVIAVCILLIVLILAALRLIPRDTGKRRCPKVIAAMVSAVLLLNFYCNFGFIHRLFGLQMVNVEPEIKL